LSFPIFLDEHIAHELATRLIQRDCDVLTAAAAGRANQAISDEEQLLFATSAGRALFTYNARDFYAIARAWSAAGKSHMGIIVCRQLPAWELAERFMVLFDDYPDGIPDMYIHLPSLR
jgi:hypothetical protein